MEGEGFEPSKAEPSDLQSDPFDRSGTPPNETADYEYIAQISQTRFGLIPQSYEKKPRCLYSISGGKFFLLMGI